MAGFWGILGIVVARRHVPILVTPDSRTYPVPTEARALPIDGRLLPYWIASESRVNAIVSESRIYWIPQEKREGL
jgi:hypothetical protein